MERRTFIVGSGLAIGTGLTGVSAYTSATVDRSVDVTVVADDATDAQIQLTPGSEGGVTVNNGTLMIDGTANGNKLTPNGEFTFGDASNPTSTYAFSITNQLSESRDFTFSITNVNPSNGAVDIELFDDTGSSVDTASADGSGSSSSGTMTLSSATTAYTVVTITTGDDTTAVEADVTIDSVPTP